VARCASFDGRGHKLIGFGSRQHNNHASLPGQSHPCAAQRSRDVSYSSSDVQKDDSYSGRGRVERRRRSDDGTRRDLDLLHYSHVAAE